MENSENQNFNQSEEKSEFDKILESNISSIIDLLIKRDQEVWTTITKYDEMRKEMQKGLEMNKDSQSFIADSTPVEILKQLNYSSDLDDLINFMDRKVEKFKHFVASKNEKTVQKLIKFQEKQKQLKLFQMTMQSFSFDENEMTFGLTTSDETTNSTIVNFIPDVNSTNVPVNDIDQLSPPANSSAVAQTSLNSSDVFQAPASPDNLQTNEVDEIGVDIDNQHGNDDEINETVVANLKSAEPLKTTENMDNKKFECEICKKFYSNYQRLRCHWNLYHKKPGSFECEICDKKFNRKDHLRRHQRTHDAHRPKPFKCQQCDFSTDNPQSFKKHQESHKRRNKKFASLKNPVKCEKCSTYCKNKRFLYNHIFLVHPKALYQCDSCGKILKAKTNLKKHMFLHMRK